MTFLGIAILTLLGASWGSEWGHLGTLVGGAVGIVSATLAAIAGELRLIRKAVTPTRDERR